MEVVLALYLGLMVWLINDNVSTFSPPTPPKNVLHVTYVTDPPGAVIYEGESRMGYAPITLNYQLSSDNLKRGILSTKPITARWISGASTTYATQNYEIAKSLSWTTNIARPTNELGREKDEQFALQVQLQKQQEESSQIQQYQIHQIQNQQILNQTLQNTIRPSPRINCTSTSYIPGQVNTNCY